MTDWQPEDGAVAHGGGVQTTALLVLAGQGRLAYRTFLFANVGDDSETRRRWPTTGRSPSPTPPRPAWRCTSCAGSAATSGSRRCTAS